MSAGAALLIYAFTNIKLPWWFWVCVIVDLIADAPPNYHFWSKFISQIVAAA